MDFDDMLTRFGDRADSGNSDTADLSPSDDPLV
jgi:hypothetical protein